MKNKYVDLEKEFKKTISQLSEVSGWSVQQAEAVLELMTKASEQKAEAVAERHRYVQKRAKVLATRHLLQNYRLLRASIERGLEHTWQYHRPLCCGKAEMAPGVKAH